MKKHSIKARVTLWYTGLFVFLLALALLFLFSFSGQLFTQNAREMLLDVVSDTVKAVEFDHGELEDSDIDFYRGGVSVFLYDTSGHLLAPKTNRGIQVDSLLEDQAVKLVESGGEKWMVHDLYAVSGETGYWVRGVLSMSGTQATLRGMLLLAIVGAPVAVAVAAAGGWMITKRAFTPVASIAQTAGSIACGGDLSLRVPDDESGDELSTLRRTLNGMLDRLQHSFESERQFTSDASHELRTPIAIILSQCEYALAGQTAPHQRRQALEAVERQAKKMSLLLSQLLLLARAENGKFTPQWEQVHFTSLCEMVALEMQDEAEKAQVRLQRELRDSITLVGDETLLMRLVTNLLSNAIRYNRPGGSVTISLQDEEHACILTVSDTGIGIPKEALESIWNRFYRVDASRSGEGTGLGLSMVRWIAKLHGGAAKAQSFPEAGSVFTVTLQKIPPDAENCPLSF